MAEITYTKVNDYLIPNLTVPEQTEKIGKYGQMRKTFLKQNHRSLYEALLMTGKLLKHLSEIDKSSNEQIQQIVSKMAQAEGVTEKLKADNPMQWVCLMNNLFHSAEEIVLSDLIYD